ncbi:MAG: hypothetical protein NT137_02250 [Methanomassiliicoccales archaeon]|nr:hypothetical protein [Methanomassiliicoccales archaeon]
MGDEDTKELAEAGSFGLKVDFESRGDLRAQDLTKMMGNLLLEVANRITGKQPLIGHVKAFIKTPLGHIQLNLVDTELGLETVQTIGDGAITSGSMNLMAAIVGTEDRKIEEAMRKALEPVALKLKITIHERDHDQTRNLDKLISLG